MKGQGNLNKRPRKGKIKRRDKERQANVEGQRQDNERQEKVKEGQGKAVKEEGTVQGQ